MSASQKLFTFALTAFGLLPMALMALPTSSSASYTLLQAPTGSYSGGGQITGSGGAIVVEMSIGDSIGGGVSNITTGGAQQKNNWIGQLYDVDSIGVTADSATLDEGSGRQLGTVVTLDDATQLALDSDAFSWTYESDKIALTTATGIATAEYVYTETDTPVAASFGGITSPDFTLTILNVDSDNYPGYALDGIDDSWQVAYFGAPPNASAGPTVDFDHDGSDNLSEYLFGFSPIDSSDFLKFAISPAGNSGNVDLWINRVVPGRTYTVVSGEDLQNYPTTVTSFSVSSEENDKEIPNLTPPTLPAFFVIKVIPQQ